MTPKEKAKELFDRFNSLEPEAPFFIISDKQAFECALIVVDEILQTNPTIKGTSYDMLTQIVQTKAYYQRVRNEIVSLRINQIEVIAPEKIIPTK